MSAVRMMCDIVGLNRSLSLCGISKKAWYHKPKPREVPPDHEVLNMVQKIAPKRPTYGTRRMAAQVSRELDRPVNRKAIQRIYKKLGWSEPARTKKEIIRSNRKVPSPDGPDEFWETDMSYVWCGIDGWCFCFNVVDVFSRRWLAFVMEDRATRHNAIMSVNNAVAASPHFKPGLTLRADNGSQYTSRDFRASMAALGIQLEYIYVNTPEQNGHVESFHKTLKKEYVWPREFASLQDARESIGAAFEDYNRDRIHSSLGYLTPAEYVELWYQDLEAGADEPKKRIIGGEKCA